MGLAAVGRQIPVRTTPDPDRGCQPALGPDLPPRAALRAGKLLVDLAGDVAFEDPDDLGLGSAFFEPAGHVSLGARIGSQAGEHDAPQGRVGLAVAAAVEPIS